MSRNRWISKWDVLWALFLMAGTAAGLITAVQESPTHTLVDTIYRISPGITAFTAGFIIGVWLKEVAAE